MKHILFKSLYSLERRESSISFSNFFYNRDLGAWVSSNDGKLLVKDSNFIGVASKKFDVEVGEDYKGK